MGRQLLIAIDLTLGAESPERAPEKPRDQSGPETPPRQPEGKVIAMTAVHSSRARGRVALLSRTHAEQRERARRARSRDPALCFEIAAAP